MSGSAAEGLRRLGKFDGSELQALMVVASVVARRVGVSEAMARGWLRRGGIVPGARCEGVRFWRVDREALAAWLRVSVEDLGRPCGRRLGDAALWEMAGERGPDGEWRALKARFPSSGLRLAQSVLGLLARDMGVRPGTALLALRRRKVPGVARVGGVLLLDCGVVTAWLADEAGRVDGALKLGGVWLLDCAAVGAWARRERRRAGRRGRG